MLCDCGNPNCAANSPTFLQKQAERIERDGYTILTIMPDPEGESLPVTHTMGLSERGLNDIAIVGVEGKLAILALAHLAIAQINGQRLRTGPVAANHPANPFATDYRVIETDLTEQGLVNGIEYRLRSIESSEKPRVLQIVIPDAKQRFPWDRGYDGPDQGPASRKTPVFFLFKDGTNDAPREL